MKHRWVAARTKIAAAATWVLAAATAACSGTNGGGGAVPQRTEPRLPTGLRPVKPEGHFAGVTCLAFSPDGRLLLSGSEDATLLVWEVRTGAIVQRLEGHHAYVSACAFLPNGRVVSGAWGGEVFVWDLETGERVRSLGGLGAANDVYALGVRPDGRELIAGTRYGQVIAWDPETGSERFRKDDLGRADGSMATVWAVGYLSDGSPFAGGGAGKTLVWNSLGRSIDFKARSGLALSGGRLALGGEEGVFLVDPGGQPRLLGAHDKAVFGLAASPGGDLLLAADFAGQARVWSLKGGSAQCAIDARAGLWAAAISPAGDRFALAGNDGVIRLGLTADCAKGMTLPLGTLTALGASRGRVASVAAGASVLLGDSTGHVSAWVPASWTLEARPAGDPVHAGEVLALLALSDGRWVSGGNDHEVFLGGMEPPSKLATLRSLVWRIAPVPGGASVLIADGAGDLTEVTLSSGATQRRLQAQGQQLQAVAVHPSEPVALAGGTLSSVYRVPLGGGNLTEWPCETGNASTTALDYLPDGRYVQGSVLGDVLVRQDATVQARLKGLHDEVAAFAVTPRPAGGTHLWAGGCDHALVRWPIDAGFEPDLRIDEGAKILNLAITADQRFLIAALGDGRASVRSLPNGDLVAHLYPFRDGSGATLFADGRFHVSGGLAKTLRLEDPQTRRVITLGDALVTGFGAVAVSPLPDGSVEVKATVFSPSGPPVVRLDGAWPVPSVVPSPTVLLAYEVTFQLDDPLGGAHALQAISSEGAAVSVPFAVEPSARFAPGTARALVIGNARYAAGALAGVPEDVKGVRAWLHDGPEGWRLPDDRIEVAENLNAADLRTRVKTFFEQAVEGETLIFYFSGHGDTAGGQGYLLPIEAAPGNLGGALSAAELWGFLRASRAGRVLVVLDACRAASFAVPPDVDRELRTSNRVAFVTATTQGAKDTAAGGAFTRAWLAALGKEEKVDRRFLAVTAQTAFYAAANEVPDQYPEIWGAAEVKDLPLSWPRPKESASATVRATGDARGGIASLDATLVTGQRLLGFDATLNEERQLQVKVLFDEDTDALQVALYQPGERLQQGKPPAPAKLVIPPRGQAFFAKKTVLETTLWKLGKGPALVEVRPCKRGAKTCDGPARRAEVK
jgi:WD40 repeat protein